MTDRLDRINRENYLRGNLIKWWNVNVVPSEGIKEVEDELTEKAFEDAGEHAQDSDYILAVTEANDEIQNEVNLNQEELQTFEKVMQHNSTNSVYDNALKELQMTEANEIYARLLREAEEDERRKQDEIEAVRTQD